MLVYWIWFAELPGISLWQKHQLLQHFSDPEEIYFSQEAAFSQFPEEISERLENKDLTRAHKILGVCQDKGIGVITCKDAAYPARLRNIYAPPMVLYYKGMIPDWDKQPVIGVVGTRKATTYGMQTSMHMGMQIAACGGLVVSGGAAGNDTMAMKGALYAGRPVVGVLGGGADVVYPASNRELFRQVAERGCLFSEYPPGTPARHWHFPERNRIISGMSNGILVVEAPAKSGALITAREAWEQGRDVFAVPGNIGVDTSQGSNSLLQQGAMPVLSGWDLVQEYAGMYPSVIRKVNTPLPAEENTLLMVAEERVIPKKTPKGSASEGKISIDNRGQSPYSVEEKKTPALTEEEALVLSCISTQPRPVDDVLSQCDMPAGKVLSILTKLTLKGVAKNHPGRRISLK